MRKTLSDLATADWRMVFDGEEINICRPDPNRRGAWIGPLAQLRAGMTETDEEGDERLCLDGEDGLILYAIAALPQFAEFVRWINDELRKMTTAGNSSKPRRDAFFNELRKKARWLHDLIDERDDDMAAEGVHGLARMP